MLNKTIMQGRFTKDLEIRNTTSGIAVCNFTLAWSEKYKDKETNCFLNCVAYRNTAEFIERYFNKGDQAIVEGKLITRSYDDSQGNKKYVTELIVDQIHFCGNKKQEYNNDDLGADLGNNHEDNDLPF